MPKPEIKVLVYTDDPGRIDASGPLGVRHLFDHLRANEPPFATIIPTLISRNTGPNPADHARIRLTDALLKDFDQVWFFGIHQENKSIYSLDFPRGGGPHSELEPDEIQTLRNWMSVDMARGWPGIGVLMAGDHANPPPTKPLPQGSDLLCPPLDHETFLGLGRAIGIGVPRAGELRKWKGPPTHCIGDNFNSQFLPSGGDLNLPQHQGDPNPQPLTLARFDANGNPSPSGEPHELFRGSDGNWIQVLPDHDHEGTLAMPQSFPEADWPTSGGFQPRPQIIAYGMDRRTGHTLELLSAYNGDVVKRGRIVADSSWHHYLNVNLQRLSVNEVEQPAPRQIGEYYRNLAFWLAPQSKRHEIAQGIVLWLATHPLMLEVAGSGASSVGELAVSLVRPLLTGCQLHEVLVALFPPDKRQRIRNFSFRQANEAHSLPAAEVLLGAVLSEYFFEVSRTDEEASEIASRLARIIERGVNNALRLNAAALIKVAVESVSMLSASSLPPATQQAFNALQSLSSDSPISERNISMATPQLPTLFYTLTLDKNATSETCFLTLFENSSTCGTIPGPIAVCKIWGTLVNSTGAASGVIGTKIPIDSDRAYITISFRFRNVRIIASGIMIRGELYTRFFAFSPNSFAQTDVPLVNMPPVLPPPQIDPADGDTGTGTGTQTLVETSSTESSEGRSSQTEKGQ